MGDVDVADVSLPRTAREWYLENESYLKTSEKDNIAFLKEIEELSKLLQQQNNATSNTVQDISHNYVDSYTQTVSSKKKSESNSDSTHSMKRPSPFPALNGGSKKSIQSHSSSSSETVVIDLTSDESPAANNRSMQPLIMPNINEDNNSSTSSLPTLSLKSFLSTSALLLEWTLCSNEIPSKLTAVKEYEIFSYSGCLKDRSQAPEWNKIGSVEAMPLPMNCTLTQIEAGKYYGFAVRSIDMWNREGKWSNVTHVTRP